MGRAIGHDDGPSRPSGNKGARALQGRLAASWASAILYLAVFAGIPVQAFADGQLSGEVHDLSGVVSEARVVLISADHEHEFSNLSQTNGSYSVNAPAGTYSLGITPPAGSGDGYFEQDNVVINDGTTTTIDATLPVGNGNGELSGTVHYLGAAGALGIQVFAIPIFSSGPEIQPTAETDEAGTWHAGQLPAGTYVLNYWVRNNGFRTPAGGRFVTLAAGSKLSLAASLSGPPLDGLLAGTVTSAEGFASEGGLKASPLGNPSDVKYPEIFSGGAFRFWLPVGQYSLEVSDPTMLFGIPGILDDVPLTQGVNVASGATTQINLQLSPLPVPSGTTARRAGEELGYFNSQRAQWGLPGNLSIMPIWADACAAHDAYLGVHDLLQHNEEPGQAGYSAGGNWGGRHSVLAQGGTWSSQTNPWNDAPIHLNQMMSPDLLMVGIDDSHNRQCLTTMPGRLRSILPGTIYTYPGDGTSGLPPAELAAEFPQVPGQEVGITGIAGRELFVYERGAPFFGGPTIRSASLVSAAGRPVDIRWVDRRNENVGPYLFGAVIIPVDPLDPYTTYTASITLEPVVFYEGSHRVELPAMSHTWSFSTGAANPSGKWPGSDKNLANGRRHKLHRDPVLHLRRMGKFALARGSRFKAGTVALRRKPRNHLVKRMKVGRSGKFRTRFRVGVGRVTIVARQGHRSAKATLPPSHRRRPGQH